MRSQAGIWGLGFRAQGLGFRVIWVSGYMGLGYRLTRWSSMGASR